MLNKNSERDYKPYECIAIDDFRGHDASTAYPLHSQFYTVKLRDGRRQVKLGGEKFRNRSRWRNVTTDKLFASIVAVNLLNTWNLTL